MFVVAILASAAGCGGGTSDTPTQPSPQPTGGTPPAGGGTPSTTVTVASAGLSPLSITVPVGSRVTFTNTDNRPHDFAGGPDPSHPECPEINVAGFVAAGQSRDTGVFTTARICRYHDHTYIGVPAFEGRIIVE